MTTPNYQRLRRFFKSSNVNRSEIDAARTALEHRLNSESFRSEGDLREFASRRGNTLILGTPRSIRITNPEDDLRAPFEELVGRQRRTKRRAVVPELEAVFQQYAGRPGVEIAPHYALPLLGSEIKVQYAYRNGVMNLVRVEAFSDDAAKARNRALALGAQGQLIVSNPGGALPPARLVVVDAPASVLCAGEAEDTFAGLFDQFKVRFVPRDEIRSFAGEVKRDIQAHLGG